MRIPTILQSKHILTKVHLFGLASLFLLITMAGGHNLVVQDFDMSRRLASKYIYTFYITIIEVITHLPLGKIALLLRYCGRRTEDWVHHTGFQGLAVSHLFVQGTKLSYLFALCICVWSARLLKRNRWHKIFQYGIIWWSILLLDLP